MTSFGLRIMRSATRFSGRAQLKALRHAHELEVTVSSGGPLALAERRECAHREEKSLLLTLDDEEMGGGATRGTDPASPSSARCSRAASSEKLI